MSQNPGIPLSSDADPTVTTCANCHLPMPGGLRFCRNCGFRLGEGLAEYTETVRFQNGHHPNIATADRSTSSQQPLVTSYDLSAAKVSGRACGALRRSGRKMSGMTWIFLCLLAFFLAAGVFTAVFTPNRQSLPPGFVSAPPAPRSYVGVNGFDSTDGGVTFGNVEPPGSPADRAGLVGGDVITSFDSQKIDDEDEMSELVKSTPVGKTVDIVYLRDGERKNAKLTTISKEDFDKLATAFRKRPEGRGLFGYQSDEVERVAIPNSKLFGVKLGTIDQSRPADLAGIKQGDIVTEFGGVPIRTGSELLSRVYRAIPYSTVTVKVIRDGEQIEIPVKMGKQ